MAFLTAAIFAITVMAVVEDVAYSKTGVPLWATWHIRPAAIFAGSLAFTGLLYLLQRINDNARALHYVAPYTPLLVLSGANLLLKLNAAWLLPVAGACVAWSAADVRKLRERRSTTRRA